MMYLGDYLPHAPEFLLFHQPESSPPRLEVIKLTGDPNVPRGEYSFIIDDLTPSTAIRICDEDEWPGGRIHMARGQIADQEFKNNTFIDLQVIIPKPERDWEEEQNRRRNSNASTSSATSHDSDDTRETNDIGQGWGVGAEERRNSVNSTHRKRKDIRPSYMDEPWVQRRVAVLWPFRRPMIKQFRRVDVEMFFGEKVDKYS